MTSKEGMNMKKQTHITIQLSPLMASVMSRMLAEEQANQKRFAEQDKRLGVNKTQTRLKICHELQELREEIYDKTGLYYFD